MLLEILPAVAAVFTIANVSVVLWDRVADWRGNLKGEDEENQDGEDPEGRDPEG